MKGMKWWTGSLTGARDHNSTDTSLREDFLPVAGQMMDRAASEPVWERVARRADARRRRPFLSPPIAHLRGRWSLGSCNEDSENSSPIHRRLLVCVGQHDEALSRPTLVQRGWRQAIVERSSIQRVKFMVQGTGKACPSRASVVCGMVMVAMSALYATLRSRVVRGTPCRKGRSGWRTSSLGRTWLG